MRAALRAQILDSLAKVEGDSLVAISIQEFVCNASMKTDREIMEAVLGLQSQINDNRILMEKLLGNQFRFLTSIDCKNDLISSNGDGKSRGRVAVPVG